jgi:tetratricopeptide (TPR) repeat protein
LALQKFGKAIQDADKCNQYDDKFIKSYVTKIRCLIELNRLEEAQETIKKALQVDGNNESVKKLASYVEEETQFKIELEAGVGATMEQEYEKATGHFTSCVNRFPKNQQIHVAYTNRAQCLFEMSKYKEALADAKLGQKANPIYVRSYIVRAKSLFQMELYADAITAAYQGLDIDFRNEALLSILKDCENHQKLEHYYDSSDDEKEEEDKMDIQMRMQQIMMRQNMNIGKKHEDSAAFKKLKNRLEQEKPLSEQLVNKQYILVVRMTNIQPRVWRRIIVPASITLRTLSDRVLLPVMGWCRNYHAYYYRLIPAKKDSWNVGPVFGNPRAGSVDMGHVGMHNIEIINDEDIKLCQILRQVGQKVEYLYDLGDSFRHKIILEEIRDVPKAKQAEVDIIDGANRPPPEDCGGIWAFKQQLEALDAKTGKKFREAQESMQNCANRSFASRDFSLKRQRQHLQQQLHTAPSAQDDRNMFKMSFIDKESSFPDIQSMNFNKPKKNACTVCRKEGKLKSCGQCHIVYYCSRECQTKDWPEHKKKCNCN